MSWYHYLACFFAGAFLTNVIPHFVQGISGNRFPTPFAKPPGQGLSSPLVNVVWGLANLVAGYVLLRVGNMSTGDPLALGLFFAAMVLLSIQMSVHFEKKHKE